MTTPDRAEISRQNSRKSTGPKSETARAVSKYNALKHGLTAKLPVLPQEDPAAFRERMEEWTTHLDPRSPLERFLIEQAVTASWKLERANRIETACVANRVRKIVEQRDRHRRVEVLELGRRLVATGRDDLERELARLYDEETLLEFVRASENHQIDRIADDPAALLARLLATAEGGHWLIGRWPRSCAILDGGGTGAPMSWPMPSACSGRGRWAWKPRPGRRSGPVSSRSPTRRSRRNTCAGSPCNWFPTFPPTRRARAGLLAVVDRAGENLSRLVQALDESAAADAVDEADQCSFDREPEGELLRRYHIGCGSAFHRMIETLVKVRRTLGDPDPESPEPVDPGPTRPDDGPDDQPGPAGDDRPLAFRRRAATRPVPTADLDASETASSVDAGIEAPASPDRSDARRTDRRCRRDPSSRRAAA